MHPHRERNAKDIEATLRIESVFIRKPRLSFAEALEEYRKIEADLVKQALDDADEYAAIEIKRRIAEWILQYALHSEQPFGVCEKAWNHLLAVGFTDLDKKCTMTCVYADCCWETEQDEVGLAVVEPVIAELEQWLAETMLPSKWASHCEMNLAALRKRRDALKAGLQE